MIIKFENVWLIDERKLMPYKINQNFHKQFEHLKDINFTLILMQVIQMFHC